RGELMSDTSSNDMRWLTAKEAEALGYTASIETGSPRETSVARLPTPPTRRVAREAPWRWVMQAAHALRGAHCPRGRTCRSDGVGTIADGIAQLCPLRQAIVPALRALPTLWLLRDDQRIERERSGAAFEYGQRIDLDLRDLRPPAHQGSDPLDDVDQCAN